MYTYRAETFRVTPYLEICQKKLIACFVGAEVVTAVVMEGSVLWDIHRVVC
jgi:hypothetical protein